MQIKLPKGFLDKLSKSTRKELEKVAAEFEFQTELQPGHFYSDLLLYNPAPSAKSRYLIYQTLDGAFEVKENSRLYSTLLGTSIGTVKGFRFQEVDFVPERLRKAVQLEADSKELATLKASMSSIKKALGDMS